MDNERTLASARTTLIAGLVALVVFAAMAYWGGMPPESEMPVFALGVGTLIAVMAGIGYAAWRLLLRPLPEDKTVAVRSRLSNSQRRLMGLLLVIAMAMQTIGGVWDEVWHTKFGIPFGEDFFWRPHLLIYAGLLTILVIALIGWNAILRSGRASLAYRFRADPTVGLLVLMGLFFVYALPADPIWHSIYGEDLSAFSIPHILLALLTVIALIAGVGLQLTTMPRRDWRSVLRLSSVDLVAFIAYTSILASTLVLLTVDWYGLSPQDVITRSALAFQRPEWLMPVFVVFIATWVGAMTNHSLRVYGAATLVGLCAIAIRQALVVALQHPEQNVAPWLLCLPPLLAIDVASAWQTRRGKTNWRWTGIVAAIAMIAVSLPIMNRTFLYPQATQENLLPMVIAVVLGALAASRLGIAIGDYLANQNKRPEMAHQPASPRQRLLAPVALGASAVFVIWFVLTATPPVGS